MPIILKSGTPAYSFLRGEGVIVRSKPNKSNPELEVALVNLSPSQPISELQILRILSHSAININVTLLRLVGTMTLPPERSTTSFLGANEIAGSNGSLAADVTPSDSKYALLEELYVDFGDRIKSRKFDGAIVVGGAADNVPFEQVWYWSEYADFLKYAKHNIRSTIFIAWAAQGALFHHYGINKGLLKEKLNGVYPHKILIADEPLISGVDDQIHIPHIRTTGLDEHAIDYSPFLDVVVHGSKTKSSIIKSHDGNMIFFTGHGEYDEDTLHKDYLANLKRGLRIRKPTGYYCHGKPRSKWKSATVLIYLNWLTHYALPQTD